MTASDPLNNKIYYASGIIYSAHQAKADVLAMDNIRLEDHHGNYLNRARYFAAKKRSLNFIYAHPFFIGSIGFKGKFSLVVSCLYLIAKRHLNLFVLILVNLQKQIWIFYVRNLYSIEKEFQSIPKNFPLIETINKSKLFLNLNILKQANCSEIGLSKLKEEPITYGKILSFKI